MKAVSVHGAGEVLANISCKFGLLAQYGPSAPATLGITTLSDFAFDSSMDMVPSSSASQSPTEEQGDFVECTESIDIADVFRAIITFSQKLALRLPPLLALRFSRWAGTLNCGRRWA